MKKITILILLLFITVAIKAQDYQISFSGSGESEGVDEILVENLTQEIALELEGSDILNLVGTLSNTSQLGVRKDIKMYPNPMQETGRIEFYNEQSENVKIDVFDLTGKLVISYSDKVNLGINMFDISGLPVGTFVAKVKTDTWEKSPKFISLKNALESPSIKNANNYKSKSKIKSFSKNSKPLVEMQYNEGDRLLIKASSGNNSRYLTIIPTESQDVNLEFVECLDLGGNNYPVVSIGDQTWMAKNLKYLPSVVGPDTDSETTPLYYVYEYDGTNVNDAKASQNYDTYGVLYNWPAAMNETTSSDSNPSGVQGVCPNGWHLPSDAEWTELSLFLGGSSVTGGKLKETGTSHWSETSSETTNETGFSALPGGYTNGRFGFNNPGILGYWWTASEYLSYNAWQRSTRYDSNNSFRATSKKNNGFSVRCIKD